MNVLDENITAGQAHCYASGRSASSRSGLTSPVPEIKDQNQVIPLLHSLRQPVLFTRDRGFFDRRLGHKKYGLVYLAVEPKEVADFIRRFLRHPAFNTKAKGVGIVVRISEVGIRGWTVGGNDEIASKWPRD